MGHYDAQEEQNVTNVRRSSTSRAKMEQSVDDELGFTMETHRAYVPSTGETRMEDHGYRKTYHGVCAPATITLTPEQKAHTVFATGGQKDVAGKARFDLIPPEAMKALAEVYSLGAAKYDDRNWEKGIPFSAALGALKRHLNAFEMGDMINTADGNHEHMAHVMWWAVAVVTFIKRNRLDLNDLPSYTNEKSN